MSYIIIYICVCVMCCVCVCRVFFLFFFFFFFFFFFVLFLFFVFFFLSVQPQLSALPLLRGQRRSQRHAASSSHTQHGIQALARLIVLLLLSCPPVCHAACQPLVNTPKYIPTFIDSCIPRHRTHHHHRSVARSVIGCTAVIAKLRHASWDVDNTAIVTARHSPSTSSLLSSSSSPPSSPSPPSSSS